MTPQGRLEVICGPMFAGKTTELIRRLSAATNAGPGVLALKPARDTRYGRTVIATHTAETFEAVELLDAASLPEAVRLHAGTTVVGVDEAHFFGASLLAPCRTLVGLGLRIIVAGVERDHRGDPFEPFPLLLCEADEVTKLHAVCAACGGPAVHSQRMFADDSTIVVGGAGAYEARCRACFLRR
jgi:thymidine kinase